MTLKRHLKTQTSLFLIECLRKANGDRSKAWKMAGISQATAYRRLGPFRLLPVNGKVKINPGAQTHLLLEFFGVRCGSREYLWYSLQLKEMLAKAKQKYLSLVAANHPDRGGDVVACARINDAWATLENRFKERGIVL